jgi:hypothetical protein
MAYTDSATLAADATFQGRVRVALTKKALAQLAGAFDSSVRFQKRSDLARRILDEADAVYVGGSMTATSTRSPTVVQKVSWALVANNANWTVAQQPSDAQLDSALSAALVDAVAGVTANE